MPGKKKYSGEYGVFTVVHLLGVEPSQVRQWCASGALSYNRVADGRRSFKASEIVDFVLRKGINESRVNQDIWRELTLAAKAEQPPVVDYPIALVLDCTGTIKSMTFGAWAHVGYGISELEDRPVFRRIDLKDPEYGLPLKFTELDRLTVENQRIAWKSQKTEAEGLGWITPMRSGENDIGGWVLTLDHPGVE